MTTIETRTNGAALAGAEDLGLRTLEGLDNENRAAAGSWGDAQGDSQSPRSGGEGLDDEWRTLQLVRRSRTAAVWLTVGIATVSFVLSFNSLRSLAAMTAWPGWPSETPWVSRRLGLLDSDQGLVGPVCIVERSFELGRWDVAEVAV